MESIGMDQVRAIIAKGRGPVVGLAARRMDSREEILIYADLPFQLASTIKICIMRQAFHQVRAGEISPDDSVPIRNEIRSIAKSSVYSLDRQDDSEKELYDCIGQGSIRRELVRRLITVSSKLATDLLLEALDARRVTAFMQALGTSHFH